jgi:putative FmdB family regulatory protein
MPTYRYEHTDEPCERGRVFAERQSMREDALTRCPSCGGPVERVIAASYISAPRGDTDLRDKGFAKLVKRSDGTYENVTALDGESRTWDPARPETAPDLKRRNLD